MRVTYCTMCYEAGVPVKTLQKWMGHSDPTMIMHVYAKLTEEKEQADITAINNFMNNKFPDKKKGEFLISCSP